MLKQKRHKSSFCFQELSHFKMKTYTSLDENTYALVTTAENTTGQILYIYKIQHAQKLK